MQAWSRRSFLNAGSAAILSAGMPSGAWARDSRPLAILNATIVDPDVAGPGIISSLLIDGGRIRTLGQAVKPPPAARVIDAHGKVVLPGLWDMHAHLAALNAVGRKPEGYVGHGVLAIRDMGGHVDQLLAYKSEVAKDRVGPEIVFAGPTLNGEAFADFHRVVRTGTEVRTAVREMKTAGAGLIKIHRALTPALLPVVVAEARKLDLPVAGHVPLGLDWAQASDAGMQIEHLITIIENEMALPTGAAPDIDSAIARIEDGKGDAIWARMAANRTYLDPTLVHYEVRVAAAKGERAARARAQFERAKTLIGRVQKAGVQILTGTDEVNQPGMQLLRELELLVEGGMSAREAVIGATAAAARAAGRPELAKISAGAPASFLILDADPLADVRNLRRLSAVILRGRLIEAAELARLRELDRPAAP